MTEYGIGLELLPFPSLAELVLVALAVVVVRVDSLVKVVEEVLDSALVSLELLVYLVRDRCVLHDCGDE